jgi:hypothetical protein
LNYARSNASIAGSLPLLYDVRQLVREQPLAFCCSGRIPAGTEHDMLARGIGVRLNGLSRFSGRRVGMDAHAAEVMTKARLEEGPSCCVERLAGGAQDMIECAVGGGQVPCA